ncbi:MAG: hypothetical protein RLY31_2178 [Bacteroidota bacterium]|jgi:hypothetical protein
MRKLFARFLLAVVILQGMVSHVSVGVWQIVETAHRMNEQEAAIAIGLKEAAGIESAIQILKEEQLTPRGYIYSDFFAFTRTDGNERVYYRLVPDSTVEEGIECRMPVAPGQPETDWSLLLEHLFREYTLTPLEWLLMDSESVPGDGHFAVSTIRQQHWVTLPSPPPDRV